MQDTNVTDTAVFIYYIVILIFIGFWAGQKKKNDARDFFLTNKRLPWYVIGYIINTVA